MVFCLRTRPLPLHVWHGESITRPEPPQRSHVRAVCTMPNGVRWLMRTWPVPPHCEHVDGLVPFAAPEPPQSGHVSILLKEIVFRQPLAASSKLMLTTPSVSLPRRGAFGLARRVPPPPKPPKKLLKMSPRSMSPVKGLPPPAPPPKLGSTPAWPNWSYRALLSLSESTSYASLTSLNFASASLSPGLRSGWYFFANLR